MKRYFTLFVLLLTGVVAWAQDLKITKIELNPRMQTALVNQELDPVGQRKCAVLHIVTEGLTPEERDYKLHFQLDNAHSIVKTVKDGGEIQLYVPDGTVRLTVKSEMGNYRCDFRDHGFKDGVESLKDYYVYIVYNRPDGPKEEDMKGSYLVMTVEPKTAIVYIDEELKSVEDGVMQSFLTYGKHTYRVEAPSYMNETGEVEIGKERVELNISLVSAKATLTVNCPDAEADIYINEQKKGRGSWTGQLAAETYIVEARKAGHRTEKQSLTLAKQEQKTVTLNAPQPICGKLNMTSTPANCEVYLDGKRIGKSPDVFSNILIGEHSVELRKDGYETQRTKVNIEEGKIADLSLNLKRIGDEVQQPEAQKPETKPEPKPQQHSGKPSAPKPERQTFLLANFAYNTAPQTSFGLTFGQVKRFGWYVNFMTNFNFAKGDFKCNDYGYPLPLESSPSYSLIGESSTSRLSLTAGAVLRCAKPFCLYLGAGYGKRSLLWKTSDGNYATADAYSYQGLAIDAGAMLHFDGFSFSVGATSVGFAYWEAKLGIGFNF